MECDYLESTLNKETNLQENYECDECMSELDDELDIEYVDINGEFYWDEMSYRKFVESSFDTEPTEWDLFVEIFEDN